MHSYVTRLRGRRWSVFNQFHNTHFDSRPIDMNGGFWVGYLQEPVTETGSCLPVIVPRAIHPLLSGLRLFRSNQPFNDKLEAEAIRDFRISS